MKEDKQGGGTFALKLMSPEIHQIDAKVQVDSRDF